MLTPAADGANGESSKARSLLRWGAYGSVAVAVLVVVVVMIAALTDRPDADPLVLDADAPEMAAFLEAEQALMAHHGLDFTDHLVDVEAPGLRVRVLEVGDGPPVLALPGGAGEGGQFGSLLAELDGYRFLVVNLPGGGGSDGIDFRAVDNRRLVRDTLDATYDHFGVDSAPILASSRGGHHAWWYALERPQRVAASAQLGVPGYVEGTTVPAMLRPLGVPGLNRLLAPTVRPASPADSVDGLEQVFGHPPETVASLPRPFQEYWHAAQHLPTFDLTMRSSTQLAVSRAGLGGWSDEIQIAIDDLAALDHPVLLVWPSNDPFGDAGTGQAIAGALPSARFEIAGVGHLPWLDDPAAVAELVARFLGTVTTSDG